MKDLDYSIPVARRIDADRRVFRDERGMLWHVFERTVPRTDDMAGRPCLIFESDMAFRRVWSFPDNWRQLSATELLALSRQR
jgi:hypothetical protein